MSTVGLSLSRGQLCPGPPHHHYHFRASSENPLLSPGLLPADSLGSAEESSQGFALVVGERETAGATLPRAGPASSPCQNVHTEGALCLQEQRLALQESLTPLLCPAVAPWESPGPLSRVSTSGSWELHCRGGGEFLQGSLFSWAQGFRHPLPFPQRVHSPSPCPAEG